jgi:hypothetical protein
MANVPLNGNDDLIGVQEPVIQAGTRPFGKNPGNTSRSADEGAVEQPGLNNFVNRSVLERSTDATTSSDS